MTNNKKDLEQLLSGFEDELVASVSREEALKEHVAALERENRRLAEQLGSIRVRSWVRRKVNDPKSKIGKVIRLPRTAYRLVRYSEVRKDVKRRTGNESGESNEMIQPADAPQKVSLVPIDFFVSSNDDYRVNLVVKNIEKDLFKKAIDFANKNKYELRVVTYGESVDPVRYRKMVKNNEIPEAKKISFYSSVDQVEKENPFKLEIGKNDIFLTDTWRIDEEK